MLQFLIKNGKIDISDVQNSMEAKHPYKIWQGKDGEWYTYLPDDKKEGCLKRENLKRT